MWHFIGIASTIFFTGAFFKQTNYYLKTKEAIVNGVNNTIKCVRIIRETGIGVCFVWFKQILNNYLSKSLVETHKRYYTIHYPYGVTWYKMIIPCKRGPCHITQITHDTVDITTDVLQYMGPGHSFHGVPVTPKMLGYTGGLTFHFLDATKTTFEETEPITL